MLFKVVLLFVTYTTSNSERGFTYSNGSTVVTNGNRVSLNCTAGTIALDELKNLTFSLEISSVGNISRLGNYCFYNYAKLSSVTLPLSVTEIGEMAFGYCTNLSTINYAGTKTQWASITKGNNWNDHVPAIVVHCSDGDVNL